MDMWIARLTATFPHTHSPAKSQTFFDFGFNVKTNRSDSNLDWNLLRGSGNAATPCRGCGIRLFPGVDRNNRGTLRIIRRTVGAALKYPP